MDDMISRQAAITAIQKAYADTVRGMDKCAVWENVGLTNALHIMQDLPSVQSEHLVKESGNLVNGLVNDCISRQAAIEALQNHYEVRNPKQNSIMDECVVLILSVPSAQPEHTETHSCDCEHTETHDLVSRQAAIDALNEYFARIGKLKRRGLDKGEKAISLDTVETIKTLPSVQPESKREWYMKGYRDGQPRWIPCSERNPDKDGRYLITGKMGTVYSLDLEDGRWYGGIKPIAWCVLPEPYKEEQDD